MRILFLARFFPPAGGAGVQRTVKFVRYLPEQGVIPIVLSEPVRPGERWTPADPSLEDEIPPEVEVFRIEKLPPGTGPEGRKEAYLRLGLQLIRECHPAAILVTMSPFGDAEIAAKLSEESGLPWVADLRDPWALDEFQVYPSRWHRARQRRRMAAALRTASLIVMNTPEAAKAVRRRLPELDHAPVSCITNGFDPGDFEAVSESHGSEDFRIVHTGSLHTESGLHQVRHRLQYWLLGRVEPGVRLLARSHFYLLRALEGWARVDPSIKTNVKLVLLGSLTAADRRVVEESSVGDIVEMPGYASHAESVGALRTADVLFLPMHRMPPGRRATIVPGKTYEYMAAGRPILAAVPDGDAKDFLQSSGVAHLCGPEEVQGMTSILRQLYQRRGESRLQAPPLERLQQFNRRELAARLALLLKKHIGPG